MFTYEQLEAIARVYGCQTEDSALWDYLQQFKHLGQSQAFTILPIDQGTKPPISFTLHKQEKEDLAILKHYQDGLDPLEEQWQLESVQEALAQQENYQDGLDPLED